MKDFLALLRGDLLRFWCRVTKARVQIGPGLKLYGGFEFWGPGSVVIGRNCVIRSIAGEERKRVMLHTMDRDAVIVIGDRAQLVASRITAKFEIKIGNDALIEETVMIDTDFHSIMPHRALPDETLARCRIQIGDRVAIGARSMITKGLTVGDDVLLIPGAIVTKNLPPRCIAGGNPAKMLQPREDNVKPSAQIVELAALKSGT